MKDVEKYIEKGISSIIPIYNDSGNSTKIITEDGQGYTILKTLRTVLRLICRYYGADISYVRKKYGRVINQKTAVPLPLGKNIVLLPFKMRKPLFIKDGSHGYVNIYSIEDIYYNNGTFIKLTNGKEIKCLSTLKTALNHYNRGKIILNDSSYKNLYQNQLDNNYYYFYKELNSPATKGDIVGLKEEIIAIKETLLKKVDKEHYWDVI